MNHYYMHNDASSSLRNFPRSVNIISARFGEELDHTSLRQPFTLQSKLNTDFVSVNHDLKTAFEIETPSMIYSNEHQHLLGNWEDELPKFHFPSKEFENINKGNVERSLKKFNTIYESESLHSNTLTKANSTNESQMSKTCHYSDMSIYEDLQSFKCDTPAVPTAVAKKEQLPTLEQIFNFNSNPKFNFLQNKVPQQTLNAELQTYQQKKSEGDINKQVDVLATHTKSINSSKNLAKRGDVVNKTILRAMKRYYYSDFDSCYGFSQLNDNDKFTQFKGLIRKYVTEQLSICKQLSKEEVEDVIFFFGSMISHIHMRRGITISKLRTQVNFVHKCLYNYSHKKLNQLMQNEGLKFVLEDFISNDGFEVILNGEETMLKQEETYREAAKDLLLKVKE